MPQEIWFLGLPTLLTIFPLFIPPTILASLWFFLHSKDTFPLYRNTFPQKALSPYSNLSSEPLLHLPIPHTIINPFIEMLALWNKGLVLGCEPSACKFLVINT
jgi:hypothetical protein